jgi:two-component system, NarL family, nitrate/nitrite response regulator NarL
VPSAVIADQWGLVRLGIGAVLRAAEVLVVGEEAHADGALLLARSAAPDLVIFGSHLDIPIVEATRLAAALAHGPQVLVLLDTATADDLAALFSAGAKGALLRSATGDELADAVTRLLNGERVLAPAFVPVLAGVTTAASADSEAEDGKESTATLTPKERQVLALLAKGHSNREIAEDLFIAAATVKTHLEHLYAKLGVTSRRAALSRALAEGLLE